MVRCSLIRTLRPGVDLNEACWDWPSEFKAQVLQKISELEWSRYPSNQLGELEHRLATLLAVAPDCIAIAPGSIATIVDFFRRHIVPAGAYIQPQTSFFMFARLARRFDVEMRTFALTDAGQYCPSSAIAACRSEPNLPVILCTPNNPTGGHLSPTEIDEIVAATSAPVLLDGTYGWFSESFNIEDLSRLQRFENLVQSYSFSKACALAGARIGFAVLRPEAKLAFDRDRLPYTLNIFALSVLSVILEDDWWEYMWRRIASVRHARRSLIDQLAQIDEIQVFPSQANFVTIDVGRHSGGVRDALAGAGLPFKSLDGGKVRISVGPPETIPRYSNVIADAVGH